jgi:hypothetical protein
MQPVDAHSSVTFTAEPPLAGTVAGDESVPHVEHSDYDSVVQAIHGIVAADLSSGSAAGPHADEPLAIKSTESCDHLPSAEVALPVVVDDCAAAVDDERPPSEAALAPLPLSGERAGLEASLHVESIAEIHVPTISALVSVDAPDMPAADGGAAEEPVVVVDPTLTAADSKADDGHRNEEIAVADDAAVAEIPCRDASLSQPLSLQESDEPPLKRLRVEPVSPSLSSQPPSEALDIAAV